MGSSARSCSRASRSGRPTPSSLRLRAALDRGVYVDTTSKTTVAQYAREWIAIQPYRPSTVERRESHDPNAHRDRTGWAGCGSWRCGTATCRRSPPRRTRTMAAESVRSILRFVCRRCSRRPFVTGSSAFRLRPDHAQLPGVQAGGAAHSGSGRPTKRVPCPNACGPSCLLRQASGCASASCWRCGCPKSTSCAGRYESPSRSILESASAWSSRRPQQGVSFRCPKW